MNGLETDTEASQLRRDVPDLDPGASDRAAATTRRRAAITGGALALLIQLWLITDGTWNLFRIQPSTDFFDAQAHAYLDGHSWVPARVAGIEGIVVNGHTQIYFGPFPALARLPIALFTHALDGRLSALSMLVAAGLAAFASVRLLGQVQRLRRPQAPRATADAVAAGLVAFFVPAGTTVVFLASRTQVYHEASMWGVAMSLLALSFVIDAAEVPTGRTLTVASVAAAAAISCRVSVGLGPTVALALLALVLTYRARRPVWSAGVAALVPIAIYSSVNWVRFHTLFSVPLRQQVQSFIDPTRPAFFAANGSFVGLQFIPASFVSYFNPAGLRFSAWFPFVDYPTPGGTLRSGVRFDAIDRVASAPATMPALVVLAIAGAVMLVRRHAPTSLRIAALGALAGCFPILVFGYIAHRYIADVVPLLVLLSVVAIDALVGASPKAWRRWAVGGLAVLAAFGVWVNVGLGVLQQGAWGSQIDQADVARFVDTRLAINDRLGWKTPVVHVVASGGELPTYADANAGDYAIVGDCDALYFFSGTKPNFLEPTTWRPVERTRRSGTRQFAVELHDAPRGTIEPLVAIGTQDPPGVLGLEHLGDRRVRLVWRGPPDNSHGPTFTLEPGTHRLEVVADPYLKQLRVDIDGDTALEGFFGTSGLDMSLGQLPVPVPGIEATLDGTIHEVPSNTSTALCRSLLRS